MSEVSMLIVLALMVAAPPPDDLARCRAIRADADRLACYDALPGTGQGSAEMPVETPPDERVQFGLARRPAKQVRQRLPEVQTVDAVVQSVRRGTNGYPIVLLDDGSTWQFANELGVEPSSGERIHIRRAALGSFMGSVNDRREARIRRLR